MNLRNISIVLLLVLPVSSGAWAQEMRSGLFVEPSVTYEVGETTVNYPSPLSKSTGSADGFGVGVRLGFHVVETIFLGLDGRYSMPKFKNSSANYDASAKSYNWGPVVGMQTPVVGLRVWGSMVLGGELDPDKSGSLDVRFKKATGYRLGAGFRLTMVSLNLEYQELKYDETTLEQVGPFAPSTAFSSVNLDNKSWLVSVSFPMEL